MTLDDLRRELDALGLPGDTPVILEKDAEGNGYSPLAGLAEAMYKAETTWSGEAYATNAEVDDPASRLTDDDRAPEGAVTAVVFWPTN